MCAKNLNMDVSDVCKIMTKKDVQNLENNTNHNNSLFNASVYSESLRISKIGMWEYNLVTGNLHLSDEHIDMLGCPDMPKVLPMTTYINNYVYMEDRESSLINVVSLLNGTIAQQFFENEYRIIRQDGSLIHVLVKANLRYINEQRVTGITQDITALRETQIQLDDTLRHLADMKYALDEATLVTFTDIYGNITYVNDLFCKISGYTRDELVGSPHTMTNSGYHEKSFFSDMWNIIKNGSIWRGEILNKKKNGELYWVDTTIVPFLDKEGKVYQYTAIRTDITDRKEAELKISHMAYHDSLTGLPNRRLLTDRISEMLMKRESDHLVTVILFDLDNFKYINDHFGHQAGDDLLKMVSNRLQQFVLPHEVIARLGGDEFVLATPFVTSKEELMSRCKALIDYMNEPYLIENQSHYISLSIGATFSPERGNTVKELLKNADLAMYESKANKNHNTGYRIFESDLFSSPLNRFNIESKLISAIEHQQFTLHYQPKIEQDSQLIGFEALIRWQTPDGQVILPNEFIPVAEKSGTIHQIGSWVMKTAIKQIREWLDMGLPPMVMGINISPKQFEQKDIVNQIIQTIEEYDIPPELIELEITEGILMDFQTETINKLKIQKEYGVQLAIDDFGTQYSSLSYLKNYPFDILKIDRMFIKDIENDPKARAIIHLIIQLAHRLGMKVTAEGVETESQLKFLTENSCDYFQGYYFSRPVELWKITEMLVKKKEAF